MRRVTMEGEKLLTIVIPVYNVEKYIRQCMDSVIVPQEQMKQLEVIVVNDGTPDNSATIAREYEEKYPETIRVIDKENGGHGSAWNVGLKKATGKYIRFLDSDDWLSDLSTFISRLESLEVDLIFTQFSKYYNDTGIAEEINVPGIEFCRVLNIADISYTIIKQSADIYNFHRCTYRTEMLQKEQPLFCERVYYDDSILFIAPLILGKTLYFLDLKLYNYRLSREGQTVDQMVQRAHAYDYVLVCQRMVDFVNRHTDIAGPRKEQRDIVLHIYMTTPFHIFTSLPYKDYKKMMRLWWPILMGVPGYRLTPKMHVYKYTPAFVSWYLIRLFDKYILKTRK